MRLQVYVVEAATKVYAAAPYLSQGTIDCPLITDPEMRIMRLSPFATVQAFATLAAVAFPPPVLHAQQIITGQAAFADYSQQKPGVRRKITLADLPEPKPSESVDNGPTLVQRPEGAWPIAPAGFKVQLYAGGDAAAPLRGPENKKGTRPPRPGPHLVARTRQPP